MKILLMICLLFSASCATKYLVPTNRFITPESQGGAFNGQFEVQQATTNRLSIDTSNGNVKDGVVYNDLKRIGFLYSTSIFDQFDFYWSHIGSGNSMLGGKLQFLGGSRTSNSTGHKMSIAAAFGGNDYETDDKSVRFNLSGKEVLLLYGYRFTPNFMPYLTLSRASYNFEGKIHSSIPSLNGAKPNLTTTSNSATLGSEFSFESFFAKLEFTYQKLATSDTKDKNRVAFGYSVGMSW